MPRDHYIPRGYLRSFTADYLSGRKGGQIFVYPLWSDRHRSASINKHVGFEPNLYDNHPLDKKWQEIEQKWPETVSALQRGSTVGTLVATLLSFVAIQFVRVPAMMEQVSRQLSLMNMKTVDIEFEGKKTRAGLMDTVKTADVLDAIDAFLPSVERSARDEYIWTCYNNPFHLKFITSDNPCWYSPRTGEVFLPLSLDLGLSGRWEKGGRKPSVRHRDISHDIVRKFNRMTVENARSFIYSHASSRRLTENIKRHRLDKLLDPMYGGRSFANKPTASDPVAGFKHLEAIRAKERSSSDQRKPGTQQP